MAESPYNPKNPILPNLSGGMPTIGLGLTSGNLQNISPSVSAGGPRGRLAPDNTNKVHAALAASTSIRLPMPRELADQIEGIHKLAIGNRIEARWESFWFWGLKIPVIVFTAGYGLLAKYGLDMGLAWAGTISAVCVMVDGLYRPGSLRNFHHRAYFELSAIADELFAQWGAAVLRGTETPDEIASRLIEDARKRKTKVTSYLTDAEASLGKGPGRKAGKG